MISAIFGIALLAFEVFNFDTTRYALSQLFGDIRFAGVSWATVLATAFCGIDFAGLLRVFSPSDKDTPQEVWYLMGAWLLGATLNAIMTWYAVSIALVENGATSPIMTQATLLKTVPVFVSILVWLTRMLFIGSLTMAADRIAQPTQRPSDLAASKRQAARIRPNRSPSLNTTVDDEDATLFITPVRPTLRRQPIRQ
ncbi:MAG: hypothetical protein ACPG8W_14425 [Candidatus Promineifilaceae bacterium]